MSTRLFGFIAVLAVSMGNGAHAAEETEFASRAELRGEMSEAARHTLGSLERGPSRASLTKVAPPSELRLTESALQNDTQMVSARKKYASEGPPANAKSAIDVTDIRGTELADCKLLAQEVQGSVYEGIYSGWTRVFQCEGRPLLVFGDRALKHGGERTLVSREQVNALLKIRGVERGVVMSRLRNAKTGNGLTSVIWRDGDKVVSIRVNDSSIETYQWVREVAESLK